MVFGSGPRGITLGSVLALTASLVGCGGGGAGPSGDPTPATKISNVRWLQNEVRLESDVFASSLPRPVTASLAIAASGVRYWFRYSSDPAVVDVSHTFRTADEGIDFSVRFLGSLNSSRGTSSDVIYRSKAQTLTFAKIMAASRWVWNISAKSRSQAI